MPACKIQLYLTCMLGSWINLRMFVNCYSIKQGIGSVTNPYDMPTDRMLHPQGCKTCRVLSWMPSWIYKILNDVLIASLECNKGVCSSKISKIKSCMQIPGTYQSQDWFLIFCVINCNLGGHLVRILFLVFIWLQTRCLQLDSNLIAYNFRIKCVWDIFSVSHNFHLKLASILDAILDI